MEIEEVAAHNADVYNTGRPSAQKRKREKAQDQLRHRMRKRNNGPSSTVVSTRLRSNERERDESTHLLGVKSVSSGSKRNSTDEWGGQEVRDKPSAGRHDRPSGERRRRRGEVPLTELVDRVIQRRSQSKSSASPMTIRALKPPAPPYAIQHPALIRKIQPVNKRQAASGGPYVVVLNRSSPERTGDRQPGDSGGGGGGLPPLKRPPGDSSPGDATDTAAAEMATWRPALSTAHRPYVHPNAEDRAVTNYRLQMQQAVRTAELRGDFSASAKPPTMRRAAPLPAIQVAYEVADGAAQTSTAAGGGSASAHGSSELGGDRCDGEGAAEEEEESPPRADRSGRFTSSQEVLRQMKARKHAKRRRARDGGGGGGGGGGGSGGGGGGAGNFNNPLRTRSRFTSKMKLFKEGLQKARELSIIQEDQSSISDRLSRLSAGRVSAASFRSVGSLRRIEESVAPGTDRLPESGRAPSPESDNRSTVTDQGPNAGSVASPLTSPPSIGDSGGVVPSIAPDPRSSGRATNPDAGSNPVGSPTKETRERSHHGTVHSSAADSESGPESWPAEDLAPDSGNAAGVAPVPGPQCQCEGDPSSSGTRTTTTTTTTPSAGGTVAESRGDSQAARESRLAVSAKSYEEADSDRGIAADTSHIKDLILPAETVQ